jgi:hypothetical protein
MRAYLLALLVPFSVLGQDAVKKCVDQHPVGVARADCLAPWLQDIVAKQGAGTAMQTAEQLVQRGVMNDCHVMAHAVGHATWRKSQDLASAFRACSTNCVQGCWHGVVEASMKDAGKTPAEALAFCDALGKGSLERRQCLHGLGHGIMHQRRADLKSAVAACESLDGRFESEQCLGGMWMQWTHFPVHEGPAAFRRKAPELCSGVRQDLLGKCAHAVGGAAMFANAHDETAARAVCRALPSGQQRQCTRGVQHEIDVLRVHGAHHH